MRDLGICRDLARAVEATGSADFHRRLLCALSPLLPWTYRYVYVFRRHGPPLIPFFEGIDQGWIDRYLGGYYRFDPFYRMCLNDRPSGVFLLRDHLTAAGSGFRYDAFLHDIDVVDDVVLMMPGFDGTTTALVWDRSGERFPAAAIADLRSIAPLVLALDRLHVERIVASLGLDGDRLGHGESWAVTGRDGDVVARGGPWPQDDAALLDRAGRMEDGGADTRDGVMLHVRFLPADHPVAPGGRLLLLTRSSAPRPLSFAEAVDGFLPDVLTPREKEIVRLALNGFDNAAIARRLGIGEQVVRNRRRGIYDKLDITSERELFRLFLDHVMGDVAVA